jgi:hypothetical protein
MFADVEFEFENSLTAVVSSEQNIVQNLILLPLKTRVEAGSNTSTVNLRVVRGDEMGLKRPRHSLSG